MLWCRVLTLSEVGFLLFSFSQAWNATTALVTVKAFSDTPGLWCV